MIFTEREIQLEMQRGTLVIDPIPDSSAYASTSVDLTLNSQISHFKKSVVDSYFDPGKPNYDIDATLGEKTENFTIEDDARYELKPGMLILAWTNERVDMRKAPRLAARVEGKSSLGRIGLGIHVTAPTIHAGFNGRIRLEMLNHGPLPIRLRPGMKICQLIFEQTLGTPEKMYNGRFAGQGTNRTV